MNPTLKELRSVIETIKRNSIKPKKIKTEAQLRWVRERDAFQYALIGEKPKHKWKIGDTYYLLDLMMPIPNEPHSN